MIIFFFVLFCFLFQLLYLTNNTLYITVDNRKKKTEKKDKLQLSQDLIQLVRLQITKRRNTLYIIVLTGIRLEVKRSSETMTV